MRNRAAVLAVLAIGLVTAAAVRRQPGEPAYTKHFRFQDTALIPIGANAYFTLQPGKSWRYEGEEGGDIVELEITVLPQVKWISFPVNGQIKWALTRVIEERETINGELAEVSRNYFARDLKTANIFYLGEDVDFYKNGKIIGHEGSWRAGVDGAMPGLMMPAHFLLGSRYFQEIAPGVAMDRAEHFDMGDVVTTPAGTFHGCVTIRETTPLEPGSEGFKVYAPKVGLIKDGFLELVEHN